MRHRIFSGWTFTRALYAIMGVFVIIQSIMLHQWLGGLIGIYFAAMGIIGFGCAAGNCGSGQCYADTTAATKNKITNTGVNFEEIKTK